MTYRVDVVLTNLEAFEKECIIKNSNDSLVAHQEREKIIDNVPEGWSISYCRVYPVVKCICGKEISCTRFTNTCTCGRDYNFTGDLLASRKHWGAETGESWAECY